MKVDKATRVLRASQGSITRHPKALRAASHLASHGWLLSHATGEHCAPHGRGLAFVRAIR
eukprot:530306-Pleurochrysis_carterae.AAC.1